jgi:HNH endonuclease
VSAIPEKLRAEVVARAGNRCEYCHLARRGQVGTFPIDHVVPRSNAGLTQSENLALACPHCNGHKWAGMTGIDPTTGREESLFNPRTQVWSDHFEWSTADTDELRGKTPCGHATIARLQMNHPDLVLVRGLLRQLGTPVH